ncbi:MAG: protein kinase, partial [Planctomycetes bacterium]|nr:protein kinase [Planctomycetota bacterium]
MDNLATNLSGQTIDRIRFDRLLQRDARAQYWLGHEQDLDIPVEVLILAPQLASDQAQVISFLRQARTAAKLNHHHILRVLRSARAEFDGQVLRFLVSEHVQGETLADFGKRGGFPFAPSFASEVTLAIAKALAYAHRRGVVHGNLDLDAVRISDENQSVKVLNFSQDARELGQGLADPFLAPELLGDREIDGRVDIFSLGVLLSTLLTGDPNAALDDALAPEELTQIATRMRAEDPTKRPIIEEVIDELSSSIGRSGETTVVSGIVGLGGGTNLQRAADSFVGREDALASLQASDARLTTLLGPGGVGKTRLAQEFGLSQLGRYADGVWFCDLVTARSIEDIARSVAEALHLPPIRGDAVAQISDALRYRGEAALLILNNFEQVSEYAAETLGEWLSATANTHFLVTSREALQIEGEERFSVASLDTSEGAQGMSPAMRLFVDRASREARDLRFDAEAKQCIARMVQRLEGMPLAIELAAAQAAHLPLKEIEAKLTSLLDLEDQSEASDSRRHSLRATIRWSWDLLSPHEQALLAQASVFANGFFLEAGEAVLDSSAFADAPFEIDIIEALVEKSLISVEEV